MAEQGIHQLNSLRQKWVGIQLLADAILAFACALTLCNVWFLVNKLTFIAIPEVWWLLPLFALSFAVIIFIHRPWRLTIRSLTTFLDQTYTGLEESAELMIKNPADFTLLQKLQLSRVEEAIDQVPSFPKQFAARLKIALACLLAAFVITFFMRYVTVEGKPTGDNILIPTSSNAVEKVLPQISAVKLTITPPAYMGKADHYQDRFNLVAEEGAVVSWKISTNIAVKQVSLKFDDKETTPLKPVEDKTEWTVSRTINKPGYYQVIVDGKLSDLYQIETIKDAPPLIHIKTPKPETYIDAGEAQKVNLITTITDDHGVNDALIYATVAKGSGEGVKFKEYKIPFDLSLQQHRTQYDLQHLFDLPKLNMEPGDELYFYVEAKDTHQQKSRTDVFKVSIQDTAALLSMTGLVNGSSLKPEFFRSERQIIMDTEQLLKQKDSLSNDKFNALSGNIGLDQKLLRLRYGKFLGEEDESAVGGLGDNDQLSKAENFNNASMIIDAMTDKHDNAEDATYLEASIKQQLKATLTEMWNAELHLRLYKPQEALPFEYKALRLLKDLQQKSRVYVAKTAYNPTPLKMEKRLTGDLDKITQPINKQTIKPGTDGLASLKNAVQTLEQIKLTGNYTAADGHVLQLARQQLSVKASAQPGLYLPAVNALNRILSSAHPQLFDVDKVERAIQLSLPPVGRVPQGQATAPDGGLSQQYYRNLKTTLK
jgi:hypothetical protein